MLDFAHRQHLSDRRRLLLLALLLIVAAVVSLCAGDRWLGPESWLGPDGQLFVWQIRLPRTLAVILIAAVMLGGGARSAWSISFSAILGALLITLILLRFARRHLSTSRLLLAGVALGIICSALMTWAVYFSTSFDLRQLMYWMMGGFGGVDWRQGWLMALLIPVILWTAFQAQPLNILALGETSARQLGMPISFWRNALVIAIGWMVGVSVALAGAIGFIGLVIPHMLRLCGITDHRTLLPASAVAGAATLLVADIIARLALSAAELPIGVVTATLGAPVFIWLLLKAGR